MRPSYGQTCIDSLRFHDGWNWNVGRCITVSINQDMIHQLKVKVTGVVSRVILQTLFLRKPRYFIVTLPDIGLQRLPEQPAASLHQQRVVCSSRVLRTGLEDRASTGQVGR
jgi:hypothetical protein